MEKWSTVVEKAVSGVLYLGEADCTWLVLRWDCEKCAIAESVIPREEL